MDTIVCPVECVGVGCDQPDFIGTNSSDDLTTIRRQMCKLDLLRIRLMDDRAHDPSTPDVYPTPAERRALIFLRQSLRPRV